MAFWQLSQAELHMTNGLEPEQDAFDANQRWFDERAGLHANSEFYRTHEVVAGSIRLGAHEIEEVGDVRGLDIVQLQCHIGLEAVSWARLGARTVTGLDFSESSLDEARIIATASGVDVTYVHGNVYDAPKILGEENFDVVYVNGNSLIWIPDLERWGNAVQRIIRPQGKLYLNLFHPLSFSIDPESGTLSRDYFNRERTDWSEPGSYVDPDAETTENAHSVWVRPVSDIINAVIKAGLRLESFVERPGQEFQQFPHQVRADDGLWYNPPEMGVQHPSTYSIVASKSD